MIDLWLPPKPAIIRPAPETRHASFLPGMFPAGAIAAAAPAIPPTLIYIASTEDITNLTTYSFASQSIGAAHATRRVVVIVNWVSSGAVSLTSATIAGVAATIHVQVEGVGVDAGTAIISALVPTGTTGTIAFTLSGTALRGRIAVFRALNETAATPHRTATDNDAAFTGVLTTTIDIPANGWVLTGAVFFATPPHTGMSWVGANEDYDAVAGEGTATRYGGAHQDGLPSQTGRAVTATCTGTEPEGTLAAISWG